MSALDLDTPLWMTLTIAGIAWGTLGIVCLRLWRKGDHHDRAHRPDGSGRSSVHAAADWGRRALVGLQDRRREAARARRVDDGVHRNSGGVSGDERDPRPSGSGGSQHAELLTGPELVALARYLDQSSRRMSGLAIADAYEAIVKVMHAADDVLHAERASRRG